jgi:hypothetical protein
MTTADSTAKIATTGAFILPSQCPATRRSGYPSVKRSCELLIDDVIDQTGLVQRTNINFGKLRSAKMTT